MKKTLNCLLALALAIACVWAIPLQADAVTFASGTCGENLTWTLDDAGTLTISGTGLMDDYTVNEEAPEESTLPWGDVLPFIKTVVIEDGVESIGTWAFFQCTSLKTATIGNGVKRIGYGAFGSCPHLETVTMGSGVKCIEDFVFSYCENLTNVTFPDNIEDIGSDLFYESYQLNYTAYKGGFYLGSSTNPYLLLMYASDSSIKTFDTHPDTRIIGNGAFKWCENLTKVTLGKYVHTIGDAAFSECNNLTQFTIPGSIQRIGAGAFSGCSKLTGIQVAADNAAYSSDDRGVLFNKNKTELLQAPGTLSGAYTIPAGVKTIAPEAFYGCEALTAVTIPASVETIGDAAFQYCTKVQLTIPGSVKSIGARAFWDCDSLTTVTIPESVIFLGEEAFLGCDKLVSLSIPGSITAIPWEAFSGCSSLRDITFGNGVKQIGVMAFSDCSGLTELTLGNSIEIIDDYAFQCCENLKIITFGNGVESIGASAFSSCTGLESVTIGSNVKRIGMYAFAYCENLTDISLPDGLEKIEKLVFEGCENLKYTAYDTARYLGNSENPHVALMSLKSQDVSTCTIPAGTKVIADSVFEACTALTKIWVKPENTALSNDATGVLFNKDKTRLIKAPTAITGAYTIPSGVKHIDARAFYPCGKLDITIPASVQSIGEDAFCGDLNYVYITDPSAWCQVQFANNTACPMYVGRELHILDEAGNEVESLVLRSDVTVIPDYAFRYAYGLKSITIPDSVQSIGKDAFWNCYKVTTVHLGDGVRSIDDSAFDACHALKGLWVDADHPLYSNDEHGVLFNKNKTTLVLAPDGIYGHYTIPGTVRTIAASAFRECDRIFTLTIPNTVKFIGAGAFERCEELETITIPEGVEHLGIYVFSHCSNLKEATIPGSVKEIPLGAFSCCEKLTKVTIAEGVKTIHAAALRQCLALEEVSFPDSLREISGAVFENSNNLKTINIGAGTTIIALNAFENCPGLTAIWVDGDNPAYSSDAKGVLFNKDKTELVQVPAAISGEYTVPGSIHSIGNLAFEGCTGLTAITISDGVGYIGGNAFEGCTGLTSIVLPDDAALAGNGIFKDCTALTQLALPTEVLTIGRSMFENCTSLQFVSLPDSVKNVGPMAFDNCTSLTDVYYAGTQEQWAEIRIQNRNDALTNATIHYEHVHAPVGEPSARVEATCTAEGYVQYTCACGAAYRETIAKLPHNFAEGVCSVCGAAESTPGDLDGVDGVNEDDVIYLLQHLLMPEDFPVNQMVDYDKDNDVDEDDVIYLLQHLLMPDDFPLT